jgi:hypothetical protein
MKRLVVATLLAVGLLLTSVRGTFLVAQSAAADGTNSTPTASVQQQQIENEVDRILMELEQLQGREKRDGITSADRAEIQVLLNRLSQLSEMLGPAQLARLMTAGAYLAGLGFSIGAIFKFKEK